MTLNRQGYNEPQQPSVAGACPPEYWPDGLSRGSDPENNTVPTDREALVDRQVPRAGDVGTDPVDPDTVDSPGGTN